MGKVYIVNDAFKHNYEPAKNYGDLVSLTTGNLNVFNPIRIVWEIRDSIKSFSEEDYLLLSGHALVCTFAINEALRKMPTVKVLIWGNNTGDYTCVELSREFWEFLGDGQCQSEEEKSIGQEKS